MDNYEKSTIDELLNRLEELAENKESAPNSEAYEDYCEEIVAVKNEIKLRII
jgi:hypothetical protein